MMEGEEIEFEVQGSESFPYHVRFIRDPSGMLFALCDCAAGQNGRFCKHRNRILLGNDVAIVSPNIDQVATVKAWCDQSEIGPILAELKALEAEAATLKKRISDTRENLSDALLKLTQTTEPC